MNSDSLDLTANRRQFLQNVGVLGGALVVGALSARADAPASPPAAVPPELAAPAEQTSELVLKLSDAPELGKPGGWKIVEVPSGTAKPHSVIVANTGEGFVACSAICTHKGCEVGYQFADRQFVCPCHKARFDEGGKVVRGPAKLDLAPFSAETALIIAAKK